MQQQVESLTDLVEKINKVFKSLRKEVGLSEQIKLQEILYI